MTLDGRATSSGINESERKRTWQEIDGQDTASKSKKEKHEIDKEGDVDGQGPPSPPSGSTSTRAATERS